MAHPSTKYTLLLDWANHANERTKRAARLVLQRPHTRQLHELFELSRCTALQLQLQEPHTSGGNLARMIANKLMSKLKPGTEQVIETFLTPCNGENPLKELLLGLVLKVNSHALDQGSSSAQAAGTFQDILPLVAPCCNPPRLVPPILPVWCV
jgi:hypothetical protein